MIRGDGIRKGGMKKKDDKKKKQCKHEPEIITVSDRGNGYIHLYHINGNVCVKCGRLL